MSASSSSGAAVSTGAVAAPVVEARPPTLPLSLGDLSARGGKATQPGASYFMRHFQAASDLHRPGHEGGYCTFAVAENRLVDQAAFAAKLRASSVATWQQDTACYDNFLGRACFRESFARYATRSITRGAVAGAVDAANLCVSSGVGALLEHCANALCDAASGGDCILLPTPTYPALYNDFSVRAGVTIVDVPTEATGYALTEGGLEEAYASSLRVGLRPRILVLLNPHNPLGTVAPRAEVVAALRWARRRGVHILVDEIYANTVFGSGGGGGGGGGGGEALDSAAVAADEVEDDEEGRSGASVVAAAHGLGPEAPSPAAALATHFTRGVFQSALELVEDAIIADSAAEATIASVRAFYDDHLHILWGFSKDWGLSGMRVGVLHSRNAALLAALGNVNYFCGVSHYVQDALAAVLDDAPWCDAYLDECCGSLAEAYDVAASCLVHAGIPFVEPTAGMFVWIDLRSALTHCTGMPSSWEAEASFTERLFETEKVLMTPGQACHALEPGFFRLCFAYMPIDSLRVGLERIIRFVRDSGRMPTAAAMATAAAAARALKGASAEK